MSDTVTGYIDHIIFRNEDNGYTVMVLKDSKRGGTDLCRQFSGCDSGRSDRGGRGIYSSSCIWQAISDLLFYRENAGRYHGYGTLSGIWCH